MADILLMTISNSFSWMKIMIVWAKFHWRVHPRTQLKISWHWFIYWLGTEQATSHYLKPLWSRYMHWVKYNPILCFKSVLPYSSFFLSIGCGKVMIYSLFPGSLIPSYMELHQLWYGPFDAKPSTESTSTWMSIRRWGTYLIKFDQNQ